MKEEVSILDGPSNRKNNDIISTLYFTYNNNRHLISISLISVFIINDLVQGVSFWETINWPFVKSLSENLDVGIVASVVLCLLSYWITSISSFTKSLPLYITLQLSLYVLTMLYQFEFTLGKGVALFLGLQYVLLAMKVHSYYMYYQTSDNANRGISFEKFLFLPTLVYHPRPGFLKRQKNWSFIASNSLAFIETLLLAHIIHTVVIFPLLFDSRYQWFELIPWLMIPCEFNFFLVFYAIFHCLLNIIAEFTRYADRKSFYGPWWNAVLVRSFIKQWSRPVSAWFSQHIVKDGYRLIKITRFDSLFASILISGFLHELILYMTLHHFCFPFMASMLIGIAVLIYFEDFYGFKFPKGSVIVFNLFGHVIFYISIARGCL